MRSGLSLIAILMVGIAVLLLKAGSAGPKGHSNSDNLVGPSPDESRGELRSIPGQGELQAVQAAVQRESLADEEPEEVELDEDEYPEEGIPDEEARWNHESLDVIEKGPCSLELTFHDSVSGSPVSGYAYLWRLGAPGNEWWTEGDQLQTWLEVKNGKSTAKDLPSGRYRVWARFAQRGADSAPDFMVEGDQTLVEILVEMPRPEWLRLHLVDTQGAPIVDVPGELVEVMKSGWSRFYEDNPEPQWLARRRPIGTTFAVEEPYGQAEYVSGSETWEPIEHVGRGIELGKIYGDMRGRWSSPSAMIRVDGGSSVYFDIGARGTGDYVAILPDPKAILEQIELPSGVSRAGFLKHLSLTVRSVPVKATGGESISSNWARSEVRLTVYKSEYQDVSVKWKPGQEPMPTIKLQPK